MIDALEDGAGGCGAALQSAAGEAGVRGQPLEVLQEQLEQRLQRLQQEQELQELHALQPQELVVLFEEVSEAVEVLLPVWQQGLQQELATKPGNVMPQELQELHMADSLHKKDVSEHRSETSYVESGRMVTKSCGRGAARPVPHPAQWAALGL